MPVFNHMARTVYFKVIYWGALGAGRRTSVGFLRDQTRAGMRGRIDDFGDSIDALVLPPIAPIRDFVVCISATVPADGDASRAAFVQGVDAVVFVADPRPGRSAANREALAGLEATQAATAQRVLQINWQDSAGIATCQEVLADLGGRWTAVVTSCARTGDGLLAGLREAARGPILRLREAS